VGQITREPSGVPTRLFGTVVDEFVILLPQTNIEAAFTIAERVRNWVMDEMKIDNTPITISLGIVSWPADVLGVDEIVAAADIALYRAKRSGGNQSQRFTVKPPR